MGNGSKNAQKRERNNKNGTTAPTSQLKVNQAAMNIVCKICKQPFLKTTRAPALDVHSQKHSKTSAECFPNPVDIEKGITAF